jgi:hypothetical protein
MACKSMIRNVKDIVTTMKRSEFRLLWTPEAPDVLPLSAAADLLRAAYVDNVNSGNNNTQYSFSTLERT